MIILLCLWWLNPTVEKPMHEQGSIDGELIYLPRPNLVKPPIPIEKPITTETESAVKVKVEKPYIPKPTINLESGWHVSDNKNETDTAKDVRKTNTRKQKPDGVSKKKSPLHVSDIPKIRTTPESVNQEVLSLTRSIGTSNEDIQEDTKKVEFDIKNRIKQYFTFCQCPKCTVHRQTG